MSERKDGWYWVKTMLRGSDVTDAFPLRWSSVYGWARLDKYDVVFYVGPKIPEPNPKSFKKYR